LETKIRDQDQWQSVTCI